MAINVIIYPAIARRGGSNVKRQDLSFNGAGEEIQRQSRVNFAGLAVIVGSAVQQAFESFLSVPNLKIQALVADVTDEITGFNRNI